MHLYHEAKKKENNPCPENSVMIIRSLPSPGVCVDLISDTFCHCGFYNNVFIEQEFQHILGSSNQTYLISFTGNSRCSSDMFIHSCYGPHTRFLMLMLTLGFLTWLFLEISYISLRSH